MLQVAQIPEQPGDARSVGEQTCVEADLGMVILSAEPQQVRLEASRSGLLDYLEIMPDEKELCFLSISMRSLFEEMNAISIPEKNAEKNSDISMMINFCMLLTAKSDSSSTVPHSQSH